MQMFEKKLTLITFTILALIAIFALIFVRKQHVERLYSSCVFPILRQIPIVGALVTYNFLASDYCSPLVEFPVEEGEKTLKFVCKYSGRYRIRIKYIANALKYGLAS